MGLFSSTGQPHKRCALRRTAAGGRGEGVEWRGVEWRGREWSGGEGRGGKGRAGQGRVPDCLGGLSRVGISSRSTRPWNGQPPSVGLRSDTNIPCRDHLWPLPGLLIINIHFTQCYARYYPYFTCR